MDNNRINVKFDPDTYQQIKNLSEKTHKSMSEIVREWSIKGLNGKLTQDNLEYIVPIIREQLKSILEPSVNRLASITSKTCIQAGAAAYLSAEAINKFVPDIEKEDFLLSYEAARKKAVRYLKGNIPLD